MAANYICIKQKKNKVYQACEWAQIKKAENTLERLKKGWKTLNKLKKLQFSTTTKSEIRLKSEISQAWFMERDELWWWGDTWYMGRIYEELKNYACIWLIPFV